MQKCKHGQQTPTHNNNCASKSQPLKSDTTLSIERVRAPC